MKKTYNKNNPKNTNEQQLFLETKMEKSGVTGNRVLRGLRKVTAMSQKEADHPLIFKATSPKYIQKYRHKTKKGLDKGSNKLYGDIRTAGCISQTTT
jgi:hypothetical protein